MKRVMCRAMVKEPTASVQAGREGEEATLLNRFTISAQDGWTLLAPHGDHPHPDGLQRVNADAVSRMLAAWDADGRPEIPIDFDHRTYTRTDDTESAGWIQALEARANGLYGRVRWTDAGEAALQGGRYRQLSPTWLVRTADSMDHGATRVVAPVKLLNVALTNQPNIQGLPMLSNSQRASAPNPKTETVMNDVYKALGLKDGATEQEAAKAVADLKAREATLQNRCNELEGELKTVRNAQVEADLKSYADVIEDEESAKTMLLHNREAAVKIFESTRRRLGTPSETLSNRQPPKAPGKADPETPLAIRQAEAVEKTRLANRCTFTEAWNLTRREKPELFIEPKEEN